MTKCPCCGFREGTGNPREIAKTLKLTTSERAIFDFLAGRFGEIMSAQDIAGGIYADDADGGPLYAESCVGVFVMGLRRKLRTVGLDVEGRPGRNGGRRLVWAKTGRAAKK
ncbi:MAG: winged helix-turn-helix domain-containing protein [Mesorhizobium sp.]|nr:MAG: winged helix-turn-helix domain-containing protein [Mesorhizobium sp.]